MAERPNALVLKTSDRKLSGGSNPPASADHSPQLILYGVTWGFIMLCARARTIQRGDGGLQRVDHLGEPVDFGIYLGELLPHKPQFLFR